MHNSCSRRPVHRSIERQYSERARAYRGGLRVLVPTLGLPCGFGIVAHEGLDALMAYLGVR